MRFFISILLVFLSFNLSAGTIAELKDADKGMAVNCERALASEGRNIGVFVLGSRLARIEENQFFATPAQGVTPEALKLFGILPGQPQGLAMSIQIDAQGAFVLLVQSARKTIFKMPLEPEDFYIWKHLTVGEFRQQLNAKIPFSFDYNKLQNTAFSGYSYGVRVKGDIASKSRSAMITHVREDLVRVTLSIDIPCDQVRVYLTDDFLPTYMTFLIDKKYHYYCRVNVLKTEFRAERLPATGKLLLPRSPTPKL